MENLGGVNSLYCNAFLRKQGVEQLEQGQEQLEQPKVKEKEGREAGCRCVVVEREN